MMNLRSDQIIKLSALVLHILLLVFAAAILLGREAAIIGQMFDTTCWAIILNLGVISGNKALQKVADKMPGKLKEGTEA